MTSPDKTPQPEPVIANLPLWKSFWIGLLGAALFGFVITILLGYSRGAARLNMSDNTTEIVGWAVFLPFYIMLMISLWKCAYNTSLPLWGHLARAYAVLTSLLFTAILIAVILE